MCVVWVYWLPHLHLFILDFAIEKLVYVFSFTLKLADDALEDYKRFLKEYTKPKGPLHKQFCSSLLCVINILFLKFFLVKNI